MFYVLSLLIDLCSVTIFVLPYQRETMIRERDRDLLSRLAIKIGPINRPFSALTTRRLGHVSWLLVRAFCFISIRCDLFLPVPVFRGRFLSALERASKVNKYLFINPSNQGSTWMFWLARAKADVSWNIRIILTKAQNLTSFKINYIEIDNMTTYVVNYNTF